MTNSGRLLINGKEQDVSVIGDGRILSGGAQHGAAGGPFHRRKRCEKPPARGDAHRKAGGAAVRQTEDAVGQMLKLYGLQFTVIGTFKEQTSTFGVSEITNETVLMPITVIKYFTPVERIDPMYVQAPRASDVRR